MLSLLFVQADAADLSSGWTALLRPDHVLQDRGFDSDRLALYVKSPIDATTTVVRPAELPAFSGFVVLAVREDNRSNAWLDLTPALPPKLERTRIERILRIEPFRVANGTVICAVKIMINGAPEPSVPFPAPRAWKEATTAQDQPIEIEKPVRIIWP